jgi:hypothetical protein
VFQKRILHSIWRTDGRARGNQLGDPWQEKAWFLMKVAAVMQTGGDQLEEK